MTRRLRALVTGGAGFIGSRLVDALVGRGHQVTVLDDLSTGSKENLDGSTAALVEGSILDAEVVGEVIGGVDAVVHLAARGSVPRSVEEPTVTNRVNVDGTLTVLEAVRRLHPAPHLVFASSSSVYGANPASPKREDLVPLPVSPYAVSKLSGEQYVLAYCRTYGLAGLAFRFFNVYGPRQPAGHAYAAVIPAFVAAALEGRPLPVHGDGLQSRDFTFVDSVVAALCDAVERRVVARSPVNLAFGASATLLEVVGALESVLGRPLELAFAPPRGGDVRHSLADTELLRSLFPAVEPVPLEVGLAQTVRYLHDRVRTVR